MLQAAFNRGLKGCRIFTADDLHNIGNPADIGVVDIVVCELSVVSAGGKPEAPLPNHPPYRCLYLLSDEVNPQSAATAAMIGAAGNFEKSESGLGQLLEHIQHKLQLREAKLGHAGSARSLRSASDHFRRFFDHSPIGFIELDSKDCLKCFVELKRQGVKNFAGHLAEHPQDCVSILHGIKIRRANRKAKELLAAGSIATLSGSVSRLFCHDSFHVLMEELQALWDGVEVFKKEVELTRFDGTKLPLLCHFDNQAFSQDDPPVITLALTDVSAHYQLVKDLELSRRRVESLSRASFEAIFFSRQGRCVDQNLTAHQMFGYTREEAIGRLGTDWIAEADRDLVMQNMMHGLEEPYTATALRKDGTTFPCEIQARMVEVEGEEPIRVTALRDISKRAQAEVFNKFFSQILNSSPNEVLILDRDSLEIIGANQSARDRLELDENDCANKSFFEMFIPTGSKSIRDVVAEFDPDKVCFAMVSGQLQRKDGNIAPVEIHVQSILSTPPAVTLVMIDISERLEAQKQQQQMDRRLQQAQKMESLGVLAGGVAHDFNNLLMTILGNADLAKYNLAGTSPVQKNLSEIIHASKRAAELAKQMLAYSGKGAFMVEPVCLSDIVQDMAKLLKVSISKDSQLRFALDEDLPLILADATQVRQVVMNLITNASEANGNITGTIDLCTGVTELTQNDIDDFCRLAPAAEPDKLTPGKFVYLGVKDTGCGMEQRVLDRIFDPFFSTKFTGRGLGMSAVLGIVRGHNGVIRVDSEPDAGTKFQVFFPLSEQKLIAIPRGEKESIRQDRVKLKRILVIDDEEDVRLIATEILQHLGHQSETATDGLHAMEVLQEDRHGFDLVLLDLTMPKMDGLQTFQQIHQQFPTMKVVLCSGYREQEATRNFPSGELHGFLQKPYGVQKMKRVLQGLFGPQ